MKNNFFRRIFLLNLLVLLFCVIFVELYITSVVRTNYIDNIRTTLTAKTSILSERVRFSSELNLDSFCRKIKKDIGARVTIIDKKGRVLGDSDSSSSSMDNHANRPEVRQSLGSGTGWSIRHSKTLDYELLYVARKIGDKGFIRLSVPLQNIDGAVNSLRLKIDSVIISVLLVLGAVLIWQTERTRRFVNQIRDYAGALAQGLFRKKLHLKGADEFSDLAQSLNDMASELKVSIDSRDEETNRLNVIIRSIPDALILINEEGTIELSNNEARKLFGQVQLDGKPFFEVIRSADFLNLIDDVKKSRAPGSAEIVIDLPEETHLSVRVSPLYYKIGEIVSMVAIFHDMTRMQKLEQMRKDFVANVSHEIKTPVTAIRGFAETLLDGAIEDKENALKFLETIKFNSERLNRLVEDLLTLSKIELGVIKINKSSLNFSDLVDSIIGTVGVRASEKDIKLIKQVESDNSMINADRDRLEQILINLVDNAIKFTDKGEIEVGLSSNNGKSYIYVKDSGVGVPSRYLPRLGERFYRVDTSRSRALGGTGLGLAIVKHLVKAHGWDMNIESEEGIGTVIKISID